MRGFELFLENDETTNQNENVNIDEFDIGDKSIKDGYLNNSHVNKKARLSIDNNNHASTIDDVKLVDENQFVSLFDFCIFLFLYSILFFLFVE